MSRTQITGEQILDNSVTSADVADDLELSTLYVSGSLTVEGQSSFNADEFEMTGSFLLNGKLQVDGNINTTPTWVTSSYSLASGDSFVALNVQVSGSSINLGTGELGQFLILKDVDGHAATYPVQLVGSIDGDSSVWLNSAFASMLLCWTGNRWSKLQS